jgi:hypothetical protein
MEGSYTCVKMVQRDGSIALSSYSLQRFAHDLPICSVKKNYVYDRINPNFTVHTK